MKKSWSKLKAGKKLLAALATGFLLFGTVSCGGDDGDEEPEEKKDPEVTTVVASVNYASSADYWTANSGTIAVNDGVLSVTGVSAGHIAIQLNDATWAEIKDTLGSKFYVQAVLKSKTATAGDKNFGPASIVNTSSGEFAYAGVNANGRTQLGSKTNLKGQQFGSLISDVSLLSAAEWPQFYTLRYEYDNGIITGYINGIQFNKNGTTTYTVSGTGDLGSVGIYACQNDFEMTSFVCGAISDMATNEDTAALQMVTSESTIVTLTSQNADGVNTKYAFLPNVEYDGTAADDPVTFDITAIGYTYNTTDWSFEVSDEAKLEATRTDNTLSVKILSVTETTATVTIKNNDKAGDSYVSRVITVNVKDMPNFVDTDYGTLNVSPSVGATGVYEDEHLELTFDEAPVLSESNGQIYIYDSDNNVVDTLQTVNPNTNVISDGTNKITHTIPAAEYNVRVDGTKLIVIPHQGALDVNKTYKVVIADGIISGKINGNDFTGFTSAAARWSFTTRAEKPTETSAIRVGTSANAHYRSVQSAIVAASDGATITVEKGTYREFLYNAVSKSLKIVGDTTTDYGADVIIEGSNSQLWASGSDDRCMFLWKGKDLTFKNITLANVFDRNKYATGQSEALYFNSTAHLAAYNSSFKGHQDTLLTKGKNWFYKCYVEGDTDFIWGYADVALLEDCKIVMLDTSKDKVPTSGAYIFETRVGSDASSSATVGKGYVLFNTAVEANHEKSFLDRRASASQEAGKNYYDQVAAINVTVTGTLTDAHGGSNDPIYIEKDSSSNQNVGIKYYGGNISSGLFDKAWEGTLSAAVYNAEYSGRNVILNKVYKKTGKYVNDSSIWDVSELATEFSATADSSSLDEEAEVEGANGTYPLRELGEAATTAADSTKTSFSLGDALTDGTSSDGYVSWKGLKYHGIQYGCTLQSTNEITVKVAGASVVSVQSSQHSIGTMTVTIGTDTENPIVNAASIHTSADTADVSFLYTGTTEATLHLTFSGTNYIDKLKVSQLDGEEQSAASISITGDSKVVKGSPIELKATVTGTYLNSYSPTVIWESSNEAAATVVVNTSDSTKATVTYGTEEGTTTITASVGSTKFEKTITSEVTSSGTEVEFTVSSSNWEQVYNATSWLKKDMTKSTTAPAAVDAYDWLYGDASNSGYIQDGYTLYNCAKLYVPVKSNSKVTLKINLNTSCYFTIGGTKYETAADALEIDCSTATFVTSATESALVSDVLYLPIILGSDTQTGNDMKGYVQGIKVVTPAE